MSRLGAAVGSKLGGTIGSRLGATSGIPPVNIVVAAWRKADERQGTAEGGWPDCWLTAMSRDDGAILWEVRMQDVFGTPASVPKLALDGEQNLLVAFTTRPPGEGYDPDIDSRVAKLNKDDGTLQWIIEPGRFNNSSEGTFAVDRETNRFWLSNLGYNAAGESIADPAEAKVLCRSVDWCNGFVVTTRSGGFHGVTSNGLPYQSDAAVEVYFPDSTLKKRYLIPHVSYPFVDYTAQVPRSTLVRAGGLGFGGVIDTLDLICPSKRFHTGGSSTPEQRIFRINPATDDDEMAFIANPQQTTKFRWTRGTELGGRQVASWHLHGSYLYPTSHDLKVEFVKFTTPDYRPGLVYLGSDQGEDARPVHDELGRIYGGGNSYDPDFLLNFAQVTGVVDGFSNSGDWIYGWKQQVGPPGVGVVEAVSVLV